jgi:transcriptional regulator with XRE-family HTH domain
MRYAFAKALKTARKARGLTQEDFSHVSSRTYVSTLERGKKSPTLDKMNLISQTIGIHLLSLLTLAHLCDDDKEDLDSILDRVRAEVSRMCEKD